MANIQWTKVADRLPADRQTVLIAIQSPHEPPGPTYDVAVFYASGFRDAVHTKDYAWERGAGWGYDRDVRNYIVAWSAFDPYR